MSIKVCFIPPRGLEQYMANGDMVMALAQYAYDDEALDYLNVVRDLGAQGKHVIMDNGANEGATILGNDLAQRAAFMGANELVLPDVLANSEATYNASVDFLLRHETTNMHYMGVVQGTSMEELQKLISRYEEVTPITTLGLPRLLLKYVSLAVRIDMANWIRSTFGTRFQIHFLGAASAWPKEVYFATRYSPHVRSIDTSLPYNYGLIGHCIDQTDLVIDRPDDYFTVKRSRNALTTVTFNEEVYREWCHIPR